MLVVEYGFGMWVNLYARLPRAGHAGLAGGAANVVVNGPAGLSAHIVLGVIIFLAAISVVVRAALVRRALPIVLAAVGLAAVLVSAGGGSLFLGTGASNASFVMALGAGLAIVCYAVILFAVARAERHRTDEPAARGGRALPSAVPMATPGGTQEGRFEAASPSATSSKELE